MYLRHNVACALLQSANVVSQGVTFLGKLDLSFHIEIRGFCGFHGFLKPTVFKIRGF